MKKSIPYFLLLFFCLFQQERVQAQENCGFSAIHEQRLQNDTEYKRKYAALNKNLFTTIQNQTLGTAKTNQIYRVPVVVHVLHLGEPLGTGTNISDAQIFAAINELNARYRDTSGIGIDTEIEFCLATRDPNGCPTTGINRVDASGVPNYTLKGINYLNGCGAADEYLVKDLSKWPTYYYYNIWVVNKIECSTLVATGFASAPYGDPYDGTVILSSAMTSVSTVLTHEVGHGLGLLHTFEGDFGNFQCPVDTNCFINGDQICDTPPHMQNGCGATNSCSSSGNWDNSRFNYMSYCSNLDRFTADQKSRMRATFLSFPRSFLLLSSGCTPSNFNANVFKTDVSCFGNCDGSVTVSPICSSGYSYLWSNGNTSNSLSNLCAGTYTLTVTNSDNYTATFPITISEPAAIIASPVVIGASCNGVNDGSINLNVSGGVPFTCGADYAVTIGNGTVVSPNTQYPAPFGNYKWGAKHQLFFHQTELQALGFNSGKIKSVALNVASISGTSVYKNFQIQIKAIPNVGSLNSIQSGLQTVYGAQTVTIHTGWNTFYFNSPFQWNGTTSLILQFCFNDSVSTFNSPVYCTTTPFKSVVYVAKDSVGVCNYLPPTAVSLFKRPNVRFGVCNDSLNYQYLWNTGGTGNSIVGLAQGNYSVTVNDANGCFGTSNVLVGDAIPTVDAGSDVTINSGNSASIGGAPTASGHAPFTYNWVPSLGLNSSTVSNPVASPNSTSIYSVTVTDATGCVSSDTVTVTVSTSIGIAPLPTKNAVHLIPSTTKDLILLKGENLRNGNYTIQVYNALGRMCLERLSSVTNQKLDAQLNCATLSNGVYFIVVSDDSERWVIKYSK